MEKKPSAGSNLQPPSFVGDTQQCVTAREGTDVTITIELASTGGTPTAICWWVVYTNHQSWTQVGAGSVNEGWPIWLVEFSTRLHVGANLKTAFDQPHYSDTWSVVRGSKGDMLDAFYQHVNNPKFSFHIWNNLSARSRIIEKMYKGKENQIKREIQTSDKM